MQKNDKLLSKKIKYNIKCRCYFDVYTITADFGEGLEDLGEFIWEGVQNISDWFGDVVEDVGDIIEDMVDVVGDVVDDVVDVVGDAIDRVKGWFGKRKSGLYTHNFKSSIYNSLVS